MKSHNNTPENPTMKDVADIAGVASVSVSRYLNNPSVVSERSKQKIEAAIKKLNYVPHAAARTLASKRSRMIGTVIPSLNSNLFGRTIEVFQNQISIAGYNMLLASNNFSIEKESEQIKQMVSQGMDALFLVGHSRDQSLYKLLNTKNIPYVLTWAIDEKLEHPCIGFDNKLAASDIARYLLQLGHTKFAVISGFINNNDRAFDRLQGVKETLAKHGIDLLEDNVLQCPFGIEEGRNAFRLLMLRADKPTAIICGSEPFAYGVVYEANKMGIKIPEEVSIVGFDDMELASNITPRLTTIRTPQEQMGVLAAKYLVSRLNGEEMPWPKPLDFELVLRESCAPPNQQ